eukprot:SAG22_NODE_1879_length_3380_cov_5.659555_1_plen_308_part_00
MLQLRFVGLAIVLAHTPVAADAAGFLGLSTDQYGLYNSPSPAFDSLHADYHFFHHHKMAAGDRTEPDGVASFGASAHVRMQPSLRPAGTEGVLSLSLCGGATVFDLSVELPPPRVCAAQPYRNNSNTAGWTAQTVKTCTNISEASPEWCRALCCANQLCSGWTYTDPQPGNAKQYDCWMQQGNTKVVPGGPMCSGTPRSPTSGGHCWSGLGNTAGSGTWTARLNGAAVNASGRPIVPQSLATGQPGGYSQAPQVDVLLDGSFAQVFFNGEVVTLPNNNCSSGSNASVSVRGVDAVLHLDTWRMQQQR